LTDIHRLWVRHATHCTTPLVDLGSVLFLIYNFATDDKRKCLIPSTRLVIEAVFTGIIPRIITYKASLSNFIIDW